MCLFECAYGQKCVILPVERVVKSVLCRVSHSHIPLPAHRVPCVLTVMLRQFLLCRVRRVEFEYSRSLASLKCCLYVRFVNIDTLIVVVRSIHYKVDFMRQLHWNLVYPNTLSACPRCMCPD